MTTKTEIKLEKRTYPLLGKEKIKKGCFFFPIDLNKEKELSVLAEKLKIYVEFLINDIEEMFGKKFEFTIGKSYATVNKNLKKKPDPANANHWKKDGISNRWTGTYDDEGYSFLIAFVILTKDNISEKVPKAFRHQQTLALALESQLIQHFCYVKYDKRLANTSLDPGRKSADYAGAVLYIAVKSKVITEALKEKKNTKRKS